MKTMTKSSKLSKIVTVAFFTLLLSTQAIYATCIADDPGECSKTCSDGTSCCIGLSPNCTGGWDIAQQRFYIDCGYGRQYCGDEEPGDPNN